MQGDVEGGDKPGVRLHEVYPLAPKAEQDDEKRPITAQEFINEQGNDS